MLDEKLDLNKLLDRALRLWYLFPISVILIGILAYFYLKTEEPVYQTSIRVMIKNDEGSNLLDEEAIFSDLGLGKNNRDLENEVIAIKSTPLMYEVVKELELQYQYSWKDQFRSYEYYKDAPVKIVDWKPNSERESLSGALHIHGNGKYTLTMDDESEFESEFGKELKLPTGKLTLTRTREELPEGPVYIRIRSIWSRARGLTFAVNVAKVEESSIIELSIEDNSPERAKDILTTLVQKYMDKSVDEKNQVFKNTITLINERIDMISNELSMAESKVENYKQRFNVLELSAQGSMLMEEMSNYNEKISETEVQLEILNSIEEFLLKNKEKFEFVPTNTTISNLTLARQLDNFNTLLTQMEKLRSDLGPSHPDFLLTQRQIKNLRQTIIDNIQSIKGDFNIALEANMRILDNTKDRMQSLPRRERELLEMERKKDLKETLYLYLLQKREESAISMAVTSPSGKVIEPSEVPYEPVSPNPRVIWLSAIFLGLALPSGFIFLIEFLNKKLQYEDEIGRWTSVPVLGAIGFDQGKENLVIKENSRTPMAEMFRLLRTNFSCIAIDEKPQVVLITSSRSGEGKSFLTLNFAMTQALANKKVVVLELDLRRPKQEIYSKLKKSKMGVVDYLIDQSVMYKQITRSSGLHPNLDLISSGLTPPNPSELILSDRLRNLIEELKEEYDMILIDTPPVGIVADALQLKDIAQVSLYVVRMNYTRRDQLQIIEDIYEKRKLPRPYILLNAVSSGGNPFGKNYGYGYGYGYGSESKGYYVKEQKKSMLARLNGGFFSKILP